jgi:transposase-like protein
VLRDRLEDSLQFYEFEGFDSCKIASTIMLDRLHQEIRRRSGVVGIFPSVDSYLRLLTSYLIEYSEDWSTSRCYIHPEKIELCESKLEEAA